MYIAFDMPTLSDSFQLAQSHTIWADYDFGPNGIFNSALPFEGSASIVAYDVNYTSILGLISESFDFYVYPNFTYDVPANFTATTSILENSTFTNCFTEAITFENIANISHIMNPILNRFEWDRLANGGTLPYTDYDFDNSVGPNFVQAHLTSYTYPTNGTYNAKAFAVIAPWTQVVRSDSSVFNINVVDCTVSVNEVTNNNSITTYPNPVKNIINFKISTANSTLKIVDLTGKTVLNQKLLNKLTVVNVAELANGFYVYIVKSNNGEISNGNFVVNK